jgi:hypothetical protein
MYIETETSEKKIYKKAHFSLIFKKMCSPCPFPQLDGISTGFDGILPSKVDN